MQRRLAGTNPNWAVRTPMTQTTALLIPATTQPCQSFLPMSTVASTVKMQDRVETNHIQQVQHSERANQSTGLVKRAPILLLVLHSFSGWPGRLSRRA